MSTPGAAFSTAFSVAFDVLLLDWDSTLTFATEAGTYRKAGIVLDASTTPTGGPDSDAEEWAQDVAAILVLATAKAGSRVEPGTGSGDTFLDRILQDANEVGAAYRIRSAIYQRTKDRDDADAVAQLLAQWEVYLGEGASSSGELGLGEGGLIAGAIDSLVDKGTLSNDVTTGDTSLATQSARAVGPAFSTEDVD